MTAPIPPPAAWKLIEPDLAALLREATAEGGVSDRRALRFEASYESSAAEAFGNLPSSPAYLSPAFLKAEPSSMNFRC